MKQGRKLQVILEMENKIWKVHYGCAFANLLIDLSCRRRIGMERGLLMADTSTSKGGWKAAWRDNIFRSFGFFMSLVLLVGQLQSLSFLVIL